MLKQKSGIIRKAYQTIDLCLTVGAFFLAYVVRRHWGGPFGALGPTWDYQFLLLIIVPLWAVLLYYNGSYEAIRVKNLYQILSPILKTVLTGGVVLMTILYIGKMEFVSRSMFLLFLVFDAFILSTTKIFTYLLVRLIRSKGFNFRTVLIVGTGKRAEYYARMLAEHREWGMRVIGFVRIDDSHGGDEEEGNVNIVRTLDQFKEIITNQQVDEVAFVVPRIWLDRIEHQILLCEQVGVKASMLADFYPNTIAKMSLNEHMGVPQLIFDPTYRFEGALAVKRVFDVFVASVVFVLTLPIFITASLLIKLTSPGPVFFTQERCGLNGRRFRMLKFRTMVENADIMIDHLKEFNEMDGPVFKIKRDPRITPVGRFLRKYSIDELPQILNVLKGDMSIVGPRPPIPAEVEKYDIWQRRRLSVRPGITCSWQVNGRNKVGFDEWMKLDLQYIDTWSFKQDMKIILKTIPAVLKGTGV